MKITTEKSKIFISCLLSVLGIQLGVAQNTSLNTSVAQDSVQINDNDEMLKTPFGVFNLSRTSGAVFQISGDELRKTGGDNLSEALRGRVPGLRIVRGTNTPGTDGGYSYVLNGGNPYILIDGQPRGLQVDLREVEEVLVLSDGTFNSLLGNLGDNGLIYVKTKGGKPSPLSIDVNFQKSINAPTRMPDLLSASEYAKVINQVASNDGLGVIYSPDAIQAYETGTNPIKYPNINYQETFVSDFSVSNYASLGIYGGEEKLAYSAFIGYSDWEGLEKVGSEINGRDIIFRTKINAAINDLISTSASVYGKFGENVRPVIGADQTFNWISSTPANAFPLKVADTAYVVSNQYNSNVLSELESGGTRTDYSSNLVFDLGLDFDFKDYIPGLKYSTYIMMRTFSTQALLANNTPGLYTLDYQQDATGQDSLVLKLHTREVNVLNVNRANASAQRDFVYGGNLSYNKRFNNDVLNLNLSHLLYSQPNRNSEQLDKRDLTFNLNGSYALDNKYIMYANMNMSSSSKFIGDNRTKLFPTIGLAWVASNEGFLKNHDVIDFLKFRASFAKVGTEYSASTFYYLDTWGGSENNGTIYLGDGNTTQSKYGFRLTNTASEAIDWVVYNQLFAGVELKMLKKLSLNLNYFNIAINGQVINASEQYATALGNNVFLPQINYTNKRNQGFNSNISFSDTTKPFKYYFSVNGGYNKIVGERISEIQHLESYRIREGQAEDEIMGYVSDGLFTAENIGSALPQFGEVKGGDIKYIDQNGDNVIDARDQRAIGNNTPRFNYGINLGFEYKGFNLDVVGMGVSGYDINLNSIAYYQHSGLETYYANVNSNLPNGNENPRISAFGSINNFTNSDYWLVDGSYFRISNAQFGYKLPGSLIAKWPVNKVKLYLTGSNLALFSKMKDLDPEDPRSGIFEYPMMRNFIFGVSVNF
ncbi:SusC/RagA family TonB-linked outer membrane protein [Algibacter pacificus]|uniref:SusC/RagA family TonB-linked outer membrane protein n=1 Tax=Algibacter pacificus TaxID=2599389 RepID=UPI0011CA3CC8|nr:SusC/RagA family TonB-linked outer membrane protein [Algibacter pacificus]